MKIALICLAFVDFLVFSVFFFLHGERKELFYNDAALDELGDGPGVIFFLNRSKYRKDRLWVFNLNVALIVIFLVVLVVGSYFG